MTGKYVWIDVRRNAFFLKPIILKYHNAEHILFEKTLMYLVFPLGLKATELLFYFLIRSQLCRFDVCISCTTLI